MHMRDVTLTSCMYMSHAHAVRQMSHVSCHIRMHTPYVTSSPDHCLKPHISQMLHYGCTRLEVGVQSVYEDVARDTNR